MKTDTLFYFFSLFLFLFGASLVVGFIFRPLDTIQYYVKIYVIVLLVYLWYRFILLFIQEFRNDRFLKSFHSSVSIVIPVYNEDARILENTIASALAAHGEKEIIVVNDGSDEAHSKAFELLKKKYSFNLVEYQPNQGKRHAQSIGFSAAKNPIIITLDSDTTINYDSIVELIKPLADKEVGAVTGQVLVRNEKKNFLTKMLYARYWAAFNIERKSLVAYDIVNCCTGAFSAYRRDVVLELLPQYVGQKFLGHTCTYGDDRHLTNLFLERGFRIVYQENAMAFTEVPDTLRKLVKQQLRWKRSFLRESLYCLTFSGKRSKLLMFEVGLNLFLPFFSLVPRLLAIPVIIFYPPFVLVFLASILLVGFIRNLPLFLTSWKKGAYSLYYVFLHEFIIYWLFFIALFTLKERKWVSR